MKVPAGRNSIPVKLESFLSRKFCFHRDSVISTIRSYYIGSIRLALREDGLCKMFSDLKEHFEENLEIFIKATHRKPFISASAYIPGTITPALKCRMNGDALAIVTPSHEICSKNSYCRQVLQSRKWFWYSFGYKERLQLVSFKCQKKVLLLVCKIFWFVRTVNNTTTAVQRNVYGIKNANFVSATRILSSVLFRGVNVSTIKTF